MTIATIEEGGCSTEIAGLERSVLSVVCLDDGRVARLAEVIRDETEVCNLVVRIERIVDYRVCACVRQCFGEGEGTGEG